ncbi:LOW QUALITY PROTEIN: transmembrane protein 104-like [Amphiura filiformis]|uniref:LOW QUALITY PROTEIN: transmembrane protein 104-like n=1 Tax=Amphiura filiformis TaxID=82378 RepID=UPI003B227EF0
MAGGGPDTGELYSPWVGLIFVFNLIVGTGALTMPKAFGQAGLVLSGLIIIALAFMSFMTATFVIEAMAAANAIIRYKRKEKKREPLWSPISTYEAYYSTKYTFLEETDSNSSSSCESIESLYSDNENTEKRSLLHSQRASRNKISSYDGASPSVNNVAIQSGVPSLKKKKSDFFDITERVEMGQMASMYFSKVGVYIFNIALAVYLYGDLAIYAVTVPKSLMNITCSSTHSSRDTDPCWGKDSMSRMNAYRLFLAIFVTSLGSFAFFDLTKTKYLQIVTSLLRWSAFGLMIILAIIVLVEGKEHKHKPRLVGPFESIPNLFGIVYSFMCHHSLPSLVTPINDKSKLTRFFFGDYMLILVFYLMLCFTAVFAFTLVELQDIYTLSFFGDNPVLDIAVLQYFLALFPVFTLSTNFPIIAITLRNNLKTIFARRTGQPYHWVIDRLFFPLLAIVPPVIVAFATTNVDELVGITGSYAGAVIQYIIPASMVYYGRRETKKLFGERWGNKHRSPFHHKAWCIFVMLWAVVCVGFVTADHIISGS